jgi:hypothetical protein
VMAELMALRASPATLTSLAMKATPYPEETAAEGVLRAGSGSFQG